MIQVWQPLRAARVWRVMGLMGVVLLVRVVAPQWMWVLLIGVCGALTWNLATRLQADRTVRVIVLDGYVVRVGLALVLFAISWWHLPIFPSLQSGSGFWQFSGDAAFYDDAARQMVHAWATGDAVHRFFWERRFILWVSVIYAVVGPFALNAILVDVLVGSLTPLFGVSLLKQLTQDPRAHRMAALLLALWPSSCLWSAQLLKDPWLIAGVLIEIGLICRLGSLALSGQLFRHRTSSLVAALLLVMVMAGVAMLREDLDPLVLVTTVVTTGLWMGRELWRGRLIALLTQWQAAMFLGVLGLFGLLAIAVSAIDLVGSSAAGPSFEAWARYGRQAPNSVTNVCLVKLEQRIIRSVGSRPALDPTELVREAVTAVQQDTKDRAGASTGPIDVDLLQRAAEEMVSVPHKYHRGVTSLSLSNQLKLVASHFFSNTVSSRLLTSLARLNDRRMGYLDAGGVFVVDPQVRIDTPIGFLQYLPRALLHAMWSPVPTHWRGSGAPLYAVDLLLIYGLSPWLLLAFLRLWRMEQWQSLFLGSYLLFTMCLLGMIVANLGTLFRLRLMFLIPWLALLPLGFTRDPADEPHQP